MRSIAKQPFQVAIWGIDMDSRWPKEMASLMCSLELLHVELLSTNTCVNTYTSARRSVETPPPRMSGPSFQRGLEF